MGKKAKIGRKSTDGRPTLDLDGIFLRALADARSNPKARGTVEKAFQYLKREIEKNKIVARYFDALCSGGCDPQELLWLIAACSEDPEPEGVDAIMGFDARQIKATVQGFGKCAGQIEQINSAVVGRVFRAADLQSIFQLPADLKDYATLVEFVAGLRLRTYWTVAKRHLIHYVKQRTGHYFDKRVAELIAITTNREDYAENAHREWRKRNLSRSDYLELPQTSSVDFGRHAGPIVKAVFVMCLYALLLKLSVRE